ncbi:MAG: ABC transporter permease [Burkholderiaceae bacterium]|nr:ABC transporter permease [Burkholderiaceae bacterium]
MNLSARAAFCVALPLLLLAGLAVLLPFGWRSADLLLGCVQGHDCAVHELLADSYYLMALWNTVWISALSTLIALALGLAAAVSLAALPGWRQPATLLASLGANFAGVPLAVAMTLLFGAQGIVSDSLSLAGLPLPFDLYRNSGLLVAYVCFQVPLALLLLMAPVQQLSGESLLDAAATLGAGPGLFWRRVGMPMLLPSLVEVGSLLFANAAAAYATPFALSGTATNVLAVRIAALVSGDIFSQPELSALLALLMFAMLVAVIGGGRWLARRLRSSAT